MQDCRVETVVIVEILLDLWDKLPSHNVVLLVLETALLSVVDLLETLSTILLGYYFILTFYYYVIN